MNDWFRLRSLSFSLSLFLALTAGVFPGLSTLDVSATEDPMIERGDLGPFLAVEAKRRNNPKITLEDMERQFGEGPQRAYPLSRIENYLKARASQKPTVEELEAKTDYQGPKEFPWVHLRRSYRDVLASEDPTLQVKNEKGFDDLEGALISYSRDLRQGTNAWSTEAAAIAPFSWHMGRTLREGDPMFLARFGLVPSISIHRVSTSPGSKGEIDQLAYRLGLFAKFEKGHPWLRKLTARLFGTYVTDIAHHSALPAGEFEFEPQSDFAKMFKIGYRTIVIPKENREDPHDTAWLAYQLRLLLHGEYGSVKDSGKKPALKEGDFFRLGPIVQPDFKPFLHSRLSLSYRYSYLPAFWGQDDHNSLFTADAEWALIKDEENRRKLALKVSYLNGGLVLTQEQARTLLFGLGLTF